MEGYLTVKEISEKWGVSVRTIQTMCTEGKIEGASKMSNIWVIPEEADYPTDKRLKNGKYVKIKKNSIKTA